MIKNKISRNNVILVGGGKSISEGLSLGLKEKIKNKCILVCNYAMFHFDHSALIFSDKNFYVPLHAKKDPDKNPDIYEDLKKEPLIIGKKQNNGIEEFLLPNTILVTARYDSPLTGIFALDIACRLKPKNIFLLGYDFSRSPVPKDKSKYTGHSDYDIHYYSDIKHRGLKYTNFYDRHSPNNYFGVFKEMKSKIYNVSPSSLIETFEKIDYPKMLSMLSNEEVNQEEVRKTLSLL